ncbi:MAG: diphosphate--fructose-6-phosphate 1-phosphotransferase [Acidobacteriota bacterium]
MNPNVKKLAILAGGGPAPGINSVVSAAAIRSALAGSEVIGVLDGFRWIMEGNIDHVMPLTIESVSRIHFRGGSHIGISRANPTKQEQHLENSVISLLRLNVDRLITIGGDDTAYSAYMLNERSRGRIRVVHVPKTIDNDLDLPAWGNTFGFQTARHIGVGIVRDLMVDAKATSRWYLVVTMGRKVGHLALGIGKAAGAALTLIPEEFQGTVRLEEVVDTILGAIIKRFSYGMPHGVAVLAEGLVEAIDPTDLAQIHGAERDAHGNLRLAEVNLGEIIKEKLLEGLKRYNLATTVVAKNIGYELRCSDPIPLDMEYTRDLGFYAAQYLDEGGSGVVVAIEGDHFKPLPFAENIDPTTGKTRVRMVDINSERYRVARRYMIRLNRDDFEDMHQVAKLAATAGVTLDDFKHTFRYLIDKEPQPIRLIPAVHTTKDAKLEVVRTREA